jgi:hypothetical protein
VLIVFGMLDLLTSVIGIACFGATEKNPLLTSVTETNIAAFSCLKLAAVTIVGILFFKVGTLLAIAGNRLGVESHILHIAYSLSLFTLVTAVTNNMVVVAKLV